jgi:GNAT superfamily N-acetyltransferase
MTRDTSPGAGGMPAGAVTAVPELGVRELGPDDVDVLDAVFDGLSAHSRHLRFHSAMPALTTSLRRILTALDGRRHVALAAFVDGRPVGVVRLVAVGPGRAELAVEVVDAWQGKGIGMLLLRAARSRARALGHRELVADVLAENTAMRTVLRRVCPAARVTCAGSELTITMPIDDVDGCAYPVAA